MKERFCPIDIAELKRTRVPSEITAVGSDLQKLGWRPFPSVGAVEFDCMLMGTFYHALLPKWQKKVGAPKLEENFSELYDRAHMLEQHKNQYQAFAQAQQ